MGNNVKKLTTKLKFQFEDPDDFPEFNVDMKLKTNKKAKHIKIIKHKRKKKIVDASTKLF
jgi:hypothetical protein